MLVSQQLKDTNKRYFVILNFSEPNRFYFCLVLFIISCSVKPTYSDKHFRDFESDNYEETSFQK